jgi:hypothetical protein
LYNIIKYYYRGMKMEKKSIHTKKESIKKSYNKPMLEELGNVNGLTKGGTGGNTNDTFTPTATRPPSLP